MTTTIFFLDLPPKTFVGIDLSTFDSSPNFRGITNVNAGLHFVYSGTNASLSIRNGCWLKVQPSGSTTKVISLKWNNELERLEQLDELSTDTRNLVRHRPELQAQGLVDYIALREASADIQNGQARSVVSGHNDDDNFEDGSTDMDTNEGDDPWPSLSSHITPRLLDRILNTESSPVLSSHGNSWTLSSISSAPSDTEHIPGLTTTETESVLSHMQMLSVFPIELKQTWPNSATGRTRTDMARDRSWYLSHLSERLSRSSENDSSSDNISQAQAAKELLGELQFCFLMVLCLANYSCLEQWKRILAVLLTCRAALVEAESYFVEVIKVLGAQLRRVEDVDGGLFELGDEGASAWLRKLLKGFRRTLEEGFEVSDIAETEKGSKSQVSVGAKIKDAFGSLEKWLHDTYGWEDERNVIRRGMVQLEDGEMVELQADELDEDEETGEYAPVVVET